MENKNNVITVRVTDRTYKFLQEWQKKVEEELGIEVPLGAIVRRALDTFCAENEFHRQKREHHEGSHGREHHGSGHGERGRGHGRGGSHGRGGRDRHRDDMTMRSDDTIREDIINEDIAESIVKSE